MKQTLIQIHYHMRAGGVTTVIQRYSETFVKLTNCDSQAFVICNKDESIGDTYSKIVHVNECEYKKYSDETAFITDRKKIGFSLEKCIDEQQKKGHVIVIAHNLALGKNLALTSAFYDCAKKYSQNSIAFFCVMHDFAEDGRVNEIDAIRNVEQFQHDIKKQMYCIGVPVKIIVPNQNMMYMMCKCGFDVTTITNPVNCEQLVVDKKSNETLRRLIFHHAHDQSIPFDSNKRLAYYPVRIIPRKNLYEAILISCIFFESSLITGPGGNSEQNRILYRNLDSFIRKNNLPVMIDVITKCNLHNSNSEKMVETIMLAADYAVSTSIAEGFGYALFEPWIQHKMLIARKIPTFSMPDGWNGDSMYSFLPVPVKWIDLNCLKKDYDMYFYECFGEKMNWSFEKSFLQGPFIDFAVLTECVQMSIIEMILNDNNMRNEWLKILEESIIGWPGLQNIYNYAKISIDKHSNIIRSEFNETAFKKTFSEVFLPGTPNRLQKAKYQKIETHFQSPEYFRLLLSNRNCRITDK